MTRLPDPVSRDSILANTAWITDPFTGQREVEEFERLKGAYDPRVPETGEQMIRAYVKFQQLGYEAYFRGVLEVPPLIAARPLVSSMWMDGYGLAEFDAATRRCKCDCNKEYVWGKGYGTCPRVPQKNQSK